MNITHPFQSECLLGHVFEATQTLLRVNAPDAVFGNDVLAYGKRIGRGNVGEYVFVESEGLAIVGRISKAYVLERERHLLNVEPETGKVTPIFEVDLLGSLDLFEQKVSTAIPRSPKVGAGVYSCSKTQLGEVFGLSPQTTQRMLNLGIFDPTEEIDVNITADSLLGRHCAIVGNTGGGKSWSLARVVEQVVERGNLRVMLLDTAGEFAGFDQGNSAAIVGQNTTFPFSDLSQDDLFAFFTPSGQSQGPILRQAIRTLRLLEALELEPPAVVFPQINAEFISALEGNWDKSKSYIPNTRKRNLFVNLENHYAEKLNQERCPFQIKRLVRQIRFECVNIDGNGDWSSLDERQYQFTSSMVLRIESCLRDLSLKPIFDPGDAPTVFSKIDDLMSGPSGILRIDISAISTAKNARLILTNAIARELLTHARAGAFREKPMVLALDEAHHFLGTRVGDGSVEIAMDAFEQIAREGRKYGLVLMIATQRPRDLRGDIFSQIGSFIVHRLTNFEDRNHLAFACSEMDRGTLELLPTLAQGEALIISDGFPLPVPIKVGTPSTKPNIRSPFSFGST